MSKNIYARNVSLELISLADLVRLTVHLSQIIDDEKPHIYLQRHNQYSVLFFTMSQFIYGFKPLMITFFVRLEKSISKQYIEYSKSPIERIRFIDISQLNDPTKIYIALYKTRNMLGALNPFNNGEKSDNELISGWIYKIKINKLSELVRLSLISQNLIFAKAASNNAYIYFTGFPIPIFGAVISESLFSPIFYSIHSKPLREDKLAKFIIYRENNEKTGLEFKLGVDISENAVPLIYVKNNPLGNFD